MRLPTAQWWPWNWRVQLGKIEVFPADLALVGLIAAAICWLTVFDWQTAGDVRLYQFYANNFWNQSPLGSQFPREYPPLAILIFSLTLFPERHNYILVFAAWMALALVCGYLLVTACSGRQRGWAYMGLLSIGIAPMVMARYDLIPALLTLAALYAAKARRFPLAYILLAIGVLVKIYPLFLFPIVIVAQWRDLTATQPGAAAPLPRGAHRAALVRLGTRVGIGVGLMAIVFALAWAVNPSGAFSAFTYASARPTQVESSWSTLVWLLTRGNHANAITYTFGSNNWTGNLSQILAALSTPVLGIGTLFVAFWQWRGKVTLSAALLAVLCLVVLSNKVFSTQYVIWLLPIAAAVEGFDSVWLLIGILTIFDIIYFPFNHRYNPIELRHFMWIITARNGLILFATIRLLFGRFWLPPRTNDAADIAIASETPTLKRPAIPVAHAE